MSVRAFADPLLGFAGPPIVVPRPERATLADLIALVPLDNEALRPHLRAKLGGVLIDPALYHRVLPKLDAFVTIVLPVHGGKGILGTLAVIALVGASLFVGGGGLAFLGSAFASGAVGANLVAGGLSLAASLLLQGLNTPQQADNSGSKEIGVASAQNAFEPGAYLQRVIGTRKVTPPMVMPPYGQLDGDDQLVTVVYGLAGPHQIEGIKVGSADIDDADDIEYEVREGFAGDSNLTLVTDTRIEVPLTLRLSQFRMKPASDTNILDTTISPYLPYWHGVETKIGPDRAKLFLTFDQGLAYVGGADGVEPATTALRVRLRKKGTVAWYNLPEFLIRGEPRTGPLRLFLDFQWLPTGSMPGSVTGFSAGYGGFAWMFQSVQKTTPTTATYWTADPYFATNKVDWANRQQVKVYLDTATFPQDGAYEIQVIRGAGAREGDFTINSSVMHTLSGNGVTLYDFFGTAVSGPDTKVVNYQTRFALGLVVQAIQSIWDEYPFDLDGQPTALIAIRARNRSVDQVTCDASGLVPDWNGSTWLDDQVTSNPASHYRDVLRGDLNAEPVTTALLPDEEMQDWHEWCTAEGWQVNAILQGQPVNEVLSIIAQAGMARPRYGATYGVVIDRPKDPVTLITQRNAAGFSFSKPFGRLPHALRVNLSDEDRDYEVREVIVYADGFNSDGSGGLIEASRFESITYQGLTSEVLVRRRAQRDMRFARYRSRLINFSVDIEHLAYTLGDLVLLETDILGQIGGRGRVKSIATGGGLITGLVLDEQRDFTKADADLAQRAVAMRLQDGSIRVEKVTGADANLNAVTFTTPFAMPTDGSGDLIVAGTLVATGSYGLEARRVLIWDIAPGPDLTAQITAIDYALSDIFGLLLNEDGSYLLLEDGSKIVLGYDDD